MKLTRRQEEFIVNLIDLNRELDGPIHYSTLAERIGVSPFTAYDMLCVLEEKGMVSSEYQLAAGKSGPGRAERLFCPVLAVPDPVARLGNGSGAIALDDTELKQFIVDKISRGDIPNPDVAEAVLARIASDSSGAAGYCADVMTVVLLRMQERAGNEKSLDYLADLLQAEEGTMRANLAILGGFGLGLLIHIETRPDTWSQMLLEHVQQYQDLLMGMTQAEIGQLADSLRALFAHYSNNQAHRIENALARNRQE